MYMNEFEHLIQLNPAQTHVGEKVLIIFNLGCFLFGDFGVILFCLTTVGTCTTDVLDLIRTLGYDDM